MLLAKGVSAALKEMRTRQVSRIRDFVLGSRQLPDAEVVEVLRVYLGAEPALRRAAFSKATSAQPESTLSKESVEARLKHMVDEFAMLNYQFDRSTSLKTNYADSVHDFSQKRLLIDGVSKDDLDFLVGTSYQSTKDTVRLACSFFTQLHVAYTDNKKGERNDELILETIDGLWYLPLYREQLEECYEQNFFPLAKLAAKVMGIAR